MVVGGAPEPLTKLRLLDQPLQRIRQSGHVALKDDDARLLVQDDLPRSDRVAGDGGPPGRGGLDQDRWRALRIPGRIADDVRLLVDDRHAGLEPDERHARILGLPAIYVLLRHPDPEVRSTAPVRRIS